MRQRCVTRRRTAKTPAPRFHPPTSLSPCSARPSSPSRFLFLVLQALRLLAEVYRRTRELWPLNEAAEKQNVTVRIDQIKDLPSADIQGAYAAGDSWLLSKRNDLEAVVERHPIDALPRLAAAGVAVAVLKFWGRGEQAYRFSRSDSRSESSGGSGGGDRNRVSGEALPSTLVVPPP